MDVESKATKKSRMLRYFNLKALRAGVVSPNSGPGSQTDFILDSVAQAQSLTDSRQKAAIETNSPANLKGADLDTYLLKFNFPRKRASQSTGTCVYAGQYAAFIQTSYRLSDASGRTLQPLSAGWYSPNSLIPVIATDGGNYVLGVGQTLQWQTTPAGASATMLVFDAIEGGLTVESDAAYWARWQQFVANALSGSPPDVWNWFLKASPAVKAGWVYSAINGAATVHVCMTAPQELSTTGSRVVPQAIVAQIQQLMATNYPTGDNVLVQSTADDPLDVMGRIDTGAWLGQYPLPCNTASNPTPIVLTYASGPVITFLCDYNLLQYAQFAGTQPSLPFSGTLTLTVPIPIQWVAPNGTIVNSSILALTSVSVSGSQYQTVCHLSAALTATDQLTGATYSAAVGSWVMPAVQNADQLVSVVRGEFASLGPGEKITTLKLRYKRYPQASPQYPMAITSDVVGKISALDFVNTADIPYLYDVAASTQITLGTPPLVSTAINPITSPSLVFVPRNIAFYPIAGANK